MTDHLSAWQRLHPTLARLLHFLRVEVLGQRRADAERRSYILWPALVAAVAVWVMVMNETRVNELRAELHEARAEVARLKNAPPQRVCKTSNRGIEHCITLHKGN